MELLHNNIINVTCGFLGKTIVQLKGREVMCNFSIKIFMQLLIGYFLVECLLLLPNSVTCKTVLLPFSINTELEQLELSN